MSHDLERAIEHLYETFARYTAAGMTGCAHCVDEEETRQLVARPLRQLSSSELWSYAFDSLYTWGEVDDFKHFLPRLFEIVGREDEDALQVEVVLAKPGYGKWYTWPDKEHAAVDQFYRALWLDLLGRFPNPLSADTALCGIGRSVDDLSSYLDTWSAARTKAAMLHLAACIAHNAPDIDKKGRGPHLANSFWEDRREQMTQISDWLLHPARVEQIERALVDFGEEDPEGLLRDAFNQLGIMRDTVSVARPKPPPKPHD